MSLPLHTDHARLFEANRFVYPVLSRRSGGISIGAVPLAVLRARRRVKSVALVNLTRILLTISCTIFLVVALEWGVRGVFVGAMLTLNGGPATNVLNVDDTGSNANRIGTLTATTLTGLGMTGGITYSNMAALNIATDPWHPEWNYTISPRSSE